MLYENLLIVIVFLLFMAVNYLRQLVKLSESFNEKIHLIFRDIMDLNKTVGDIEARLFVYFNHLENLENEKSKTNN